MEDEKDFDFENETNSEDEQIGLVKWCAKEEFKRGKARSIDTSQKLDEIIEQNKCLDVAMPVVDSNLPKTNEKKESCYLACRVT